MPNTILVDDPAAPLDFHLKQFAFGRIQLESKLVEPFDYGLDHIHEFAHSVRVS